MIPFPVRLPELNGEAGSQQRNDWSKSLDMAFNEVLRDADIEPEPEWVRAIGVIRNALDDSFTLITWERQFLFKRAMQKLYRMKAKGLQHRDVMEALILLSEKGYMP